jgi:hypothetical protein
MDNQLKYILLNNYERSIPSKRDTEDFIINFHQYRAKKKAQEKTYYSLALLFLLIVTLLGSIAIKETKNNLDIQTASGQVNK